MHLVTNGTMPAAGQSVPGSLKSLSQIYMHACVRECAYVYMCVSLQDHK